MDKELNNWLDNYLEEYDDGEYDIMVDDTVHYILTKIGENGDPKKIADKIRHYAMILLKDDGFYPLQLADRMAKQAIERYKDGLYSTNWKD